MYTFVPVCKIGSIPTFHHLHDKALDIMSHTRFADTMMGVVTPPGEREASKFHGSPSPILDKAGGPNPVCFPTRMHIYTHTKKYLSGYQQCVQFPQQFLALIAGP